MTTDELGQRFIAMRRTGVSTRDALTALSRAGTAAGVYVDPVNAAKAAYMRGDIEVDEFERRVEAILAARA